MIDEKPLGQGPPERRTGNNHAQESRRDDGVLHRTLTELVS